MDASRFGILFWNLWTEVCGVSSLRVVFFFSKSERSGGCSHFSQRLHSGSDSTVNSIDGGAWTKTPTLFFLSFFFSPSFSPCFFLLGWLRSPAWSETWTQQADTKWWVLTTKTPSDRKRGLAHDYCSILNFLRVTHGSPNITKTTSWMCTHVLFELLYFIFLIYFCIVLFSPEHFRVG